MIRSNAGRRDKAKEDKGVVVTMPGLVGVTGYMAYHDGGPRAMRFLNLLFRGAAARGCSHEKALRRLFSRKVRLDDSEIKQVELLIYQLVDTLTDQGVADLWAQFGKQKDGAPARTEQPESVATTNPPNGVIDEGDVAMEKVKKQRSEFEFLYYKSEDNPDLADCLEEGEPLAVMIGDFSIELEHLGKWLAIAERDGKSLEQVLREDWDAHFDESNVVSLDDLRKRDQERDSLTIEDLTKGVSW